MIEKVWPTVSKSKKAHMACLEMSCKLREVAAVSHFSCASRLWQRGKSSTDGTFKTSGLSRHRIFCLVVTSSTSPCFYTREISGSMWISFLCARGWALSRRRREGFGVSENAHGSWNLLSSNAGRNKKQIYKKGLLFVCYTVGEFFISSLVQNSSKDRRETRGRLKERATQKFFNDVPARRSGEVPTFI